MRNILLAAGAAALAIAAPALAKPDKGGGHQGHGGGKSDRADHGGGSRHHAKAERQRGSERHAAKADRHRGSDHRAAKLARSSERKVRSSERRHAERHAFVDHKRGHDRIKQARVEHKERNGIRYATVERGRRNDLVRFQRNDDRRDSVRLAFADRDRDFRIDGCPPGLAAKGNGCLPPGQAKKLLGQRVPDNWERALLPAYYRTYYPDNDRYFYRSGSDGLMYRIARSTGLVDGYSPLFGYGADHTPDYYYPGERYPLDYVSFYNVPQPYQRYYQDEGDWLYRYGDGGIYRVNRSNGLVDSIAALLAGDLAVGQPLPVGYDVYNVPYASRDEYYDTPDRWYRYNDGYIYQVDPTTRLVQAVIQALV